MEINLGLITLTYVVKLLLLKCALLIKYTLIYEWDAEFHDKNVQNSTYESDQKTTRTIPNKSVEHFLHSVDYESSDVND